LQPWEGYMKNNTARKWDKLAVRNTPQKPARKPGLSLIHKNELEIMKDKDLDGRDTALVLSVKAIFYGTIVG